MPNSPEPKVETAAALPPDKSRFKFQKMLQPFAIKPSVATPIIWFLLDWLVLGVAIGSLLFVDAVWVVVFIVVYGLGR